MRAGANLRGARSIPMISGATISPSHGNSPESLARKVAVSEENIGCFRDEPVVAQKKGYLRSKNSEVSV